MPSLPTSDAPTLADEPVHADQITAPGRYMAPVDALGDPEILECIAISMDRQGMPLAAAKIREAAATLATMQAREAELVGALVQARNDLLEVGNDYPGSSCQKWCAERATAAWNALKPWESCPSTHCERAQECRSVNECSGEKRTLNHVNIAALADLIADTADHPEPEIDAIRSASDERG